MASKNNEYTLVLQCNNKYWDENNGVDIDHTNQNCTVSQLSLKTFNRHFDWRSVWDQDPNAGLLRSGLGELVNKYKYEFATNYYTYVTDNNSFIEITVHTDALGDHLQMVLDFVDAYIYNCKQGFSMWLQEIGFENNGWNKFDAKKLVQCKHKKYTHMSFSQKDDDLVEICKCNSCGKTFYNLIESV